MRSLSGQSKLSEMFSSRLPPGLGPNVLARALARVRASGVPFYDLTETNPTAVGLPYPDGLPGLLARPEVAEYRPHPLGDLDARRAVADEFRARGLEVSPARLLLTASTSEAYSHLFKLLCDPGDAVLVPQPSYPLFDLLTRFDAVRPVPYQLDPRGAWCLDRGSLTDALTPATRAILVVSPNNPTGSMLRADDREWLVRLAASRDLALVADEVFADYPLRPRPDAASLAGESRVLTFVLGGLSKSAGLPQMKLAWTCVSGPADLAAEAMTRLEVVADSYLSVSTPVQAAAGALIDAGRAVRRAIAARLVRNLDAARAAVAAVPAVTLCDPEGGWSAVLRVPAILSEEQMAVRLLDEAGVLVHPGYFFDFAEEAYLVLSLLPAPAVFDEGLARLLELLSKGSS